MAAVGPADAVFRSSIAPWLSIHDSRGALAFYQAAFGAVELYRLDVPDGVIARLSVDDAQFWIGQESSDAAGGQRTPVGGGTVRMLLSVADPDALFARAVAAGAAAVVPVGEAHGWRVGRLIDPFGLHWEIGRELTRS